MQAYRVPTRAVFSRILLCHSPRRLEIPASCLDLAQSFSQQSVLPFPSRSFRTTPQALGVLDKMRSAYDTASAGSEAKREAAVFKAQMKYLTSPRRIDGDVFLEMLGLLREASGLSGIKEHLPWVTNNPALAEFKNQEAIVRALTPAERRDTFQIGIAGVKRVAAATGQELHAVEGILSQIASLTAIQKWMGKRMEDGLPLPQSSAEMQHMMMKPGSGVSRRRPKGKRFSPGVKGSTMRS